MDEKRYVNDAHRAFHEGREYWQVYVQLNGYAFRPTRQGIRRLSKKLGMAPRQFEPQIWAFLEA